MNANSLERTIISGTKIGGAPKKLCPPRRLSDTISFGKSASGLTLWSREGRWAGQGEWSEGRTSEEKSAPDLEVATQGAAPVEIQGV